LARWALVGVVLALPSIAATQTPAPPATLDEIPSAKREDVARLLRKVRHRHGDDAVVIQSQLLINAMQKGSVLATGVRVERVQESYGKRYLGFVVETGLVFDDATRDQVARAQILWATIMEPTLSRLEDGLQVEADGMMVHMQFHRRPYRSVAELRASIDQPGMAGECRFYVLATDLAAVVRGELTLRTLLGRSRTTCDGMELAVAPPRDDQPLTPGPD
jgi:hypothetical protein